MPSSDAPKSPPFAGTARQLELELSGDLSCCGEQRISPSRRPRPFLKWAGGKTQLLKHLVPLAKSMPFGTYHEPFVGGGALFFELDRLGLVHRAILSDINPSLIDAYIGVKLYPEKVIEYLRVHERMHDERYYYEVRASVPQSAAERAARVIYLNKTAYNGLYRENKKGQFNVPFGRYENPTILDEPNLLAANKSLQKARIVLAPFESVLTRAREGDLVYFDPPYMPISPTSSFTSYSAGGFTGDDQRRLSIVVQELTANGVKVIVSNSFHPYILSLYEGFKVLEVFAKRTVNSRGDGRGKVREVIITNF